MDSSSATAASPPSVAYASKNAVFSADDPVAHRRVLYRALETREDRPVLALGAGAHNRQSDVAIVVVQRALQCLHRAGRADLRERGDSGARGGFRTRIQSAREGRDRGWRPELARAADRLERNGRRRPRSAP